MRRDMVKLLRIDKILSSQNIASRKEIKSLIKQGRIKVNGQTVKKPEEKLDPYSCRITVDDTVVLYKRFIYIMLNKPKGILSASRDSREKTVLDLLPTELNRHGLFPAGRLDRNTEGLLIITDDGDFAHKMLAPKSHVYKLYEVTVDRALSDEDIEAFKTGISEGGDAFKPAGMRITGERTALVEICEGKFHQIKRMFHAVGAEVQELKRIRVGELSLDADLPAGSSRELMRDEVVLALSRRRAL